MSISSQNAARNGKFLPKYKTVKAKYSHTRTEKLLWDLGLQSPVCFWSAKSRGFPIKSTLKTGKALDFEFLDCEEPKEGQNPQTPLDFEPRTVSFMFNP